MKLLRPKRASLVLWAAAAVFIAALVAAAALLIFSFRTSALDEVQAQLDLYVSGVQASLNRTILNVDVLLASTANAFNAPSTGSGRAVTPDVSAALASSARLNLSVRMVAVLNAQGIVVASSDARAAAVQMRLPDGFIDRVLGTMISTAVVSAPTASQTSAEEVVYFARHLRSPDNEVLVAVAEVPVNVLVEVLRQGAQIEGLEAVLETGSGNVILRLHNLRVEPKPARVLPLRDAEVRVGNISKSGNATVWDATTRISGVPGSVVAHPIIFDDLWVSGSVPRSVALSNWRADALAVAGVTAVFVLLGLLATFLFTQYLQRISRARRALAQSKEQLDQALEAMTSGFVLLDNKQCVLHWNKRFDEMFPWIAGFMATNLPFRKILEATVLRHLPHAGESARKKWVDHRLAMQTISDREHDQVLPNGRTLRITEHRTPDGGLVITYTDITEMRRARAEIETLAFYDPLTGLPNRRLLLDRLGQATERAHRFGRLGALLFLDLDEFKAINDSLGHDVGDVLLQEVAKRLKQSVREADTVARLGGDEFVIMLTDLSPSALEAASQTHILSKKLLENLSGVYQLRGQGYQSTVSLGATLFGHELQSAAELLRQADIAMYHVKARQGNGLCFYDVEMQTAISSRVQLDAEMRQALRNGEFVLHYQAQFSDTGGIFGAEALLRWQHPERGLLLPKAFIAAAEESDIIVGIGGWVLRAACLQLAAWQKDPRCMNLQLSINVSARQFRHAGFVSQVLHEVACLGSRAHLLTLELTESLVIDDIQETVRRMHQLRQRGIRFAVDDFGTGYSSLAYLTSLPLHQLKIDQSFVRSLGSRPSDEVIVQTIIGMAHNLELEVIAEGVETEEQLMLLRGYGCSFFQGFLLAKPLPLAELSALLSESGLEVLSV